MEEEDFKKLESFSDLKSLAGFTSQFFPSFSIKGSGKDLLEFERNLYNIFFKIIEKILIASPREMQNFLKSFLIPFEIQNLRMGIIHTITNVSNTPNPQQKSNDKIRSMIYRRPQEILEREHIFKGLIKANNLQDILKLIKGTPYELILEREIQNYADTGEIFGLFQSLDRQNHLQMIKAAKKLPKKMKMIILKFILTNVDLYNIKLLYRATYNEIPLNKVKQYLILDGHRITSAHLQKMLKFTTLTNFSEILQEVFSDIKEIDYIVKGIINNNHNAWNILNEEIFENLQLSMQKDVHWEISDMSISLIFKIILYKRVEINNILARATQLGLSASI